MKKAALIAPLFLIACSGQQSATPPRPVAPVDSWTYVNVYTDPQNGCQYIALGMRSGITPRLNADGTQICKPTNPAQKDDAP